jgi:hypothetical protein
MKNPILRTLISAFLFTLISGIVVLVIGYMLRWKNPPQFSDGFFWAGFIMITIGLISYQGYSKPTKPWPLSHLTADERSNLWVADIFRGRIIMIVFGFSGLLLFCLSLLVLRLF